MIRVKTEAELAAEVEGWVTVVQRVSFPEEFNISTKKHSDVKYVLLNY
jgi:hypothetical protein